MVPLIFCIRVWLSWVSPQRVYMNADSLAWFVLIGWYVVFFVVRRLGHVRSATTVDWHFAWKSKRERTMCDERDELSSFVYVLQDDATSSGQFFIIHDLCLFSNRIESLWQINKIVCFFLSLFWLTHYWCFFSPFCFMFHKTRSQMFCSSLLMHAVSWWFDEMWKWIYNTDVVFHIHSVVIVMNVHEISSKFHWRGRNS